jgi:hypothetical protein
MPDYLVYSGFRLPEVRMRSIALVCLSLVSTAMVAAVFSQGRALNQPPPGFTSLFNGKDLTGWRGRKPNFDPTVERSFSPAERTALQTIWNAERDQHWRVDVATGEIVSDGKDPHLATDKDYGDIELYVDWLMVSPNGDSGIYLRSYPQVQIWDPANPAEVRNGAEKGSGALWNNNADNPGKWPLVKADNPVGQWNTFRIKMIGSKVSVWFNDKLTVDNQVLDNYFNRTQALVAKGAIELQTHGSEIRFRNIFVREIPASEAAAAR